MQNTPQPLDELLSKLGVSNADLVRASTEQLSFKMVQKGRKGRRLTSAIQDKILNALVKLKPDIKFRRRELFSYPMDEAVVEKINEAHFLSSQYKISYPQWIDRLIEAGINHYAVAPALDQITFYGAAGEVYAKKGANILTESLGSFDLAGLKSAISLAQTKSISHAEFLKKIHKAGIVSYEVNLRQRKIVYKGVAESYREDIPQAVIELKTSQPAPASEEPAKKTPRVKKKKPGIVRTTRKARLSARKRYFSKKRRPKK